MGIIIKFSLPKTMTACQANADCAEITDGCCYGATITSFPEDALYGDKATEMWGETGLPEVGGFYAECAMAADLEGAEALEGVEVSGYDVLTWWLAEASEEELAAMEIFPEDTADTVIELDGGDVYTYQNTFMTFGCAADEAEEGASALVAASAAVLAVA